jgi:hypothetical protein
MLNSLPHPFFVFLFIFISHSCYARKKEMPGGYKESPGNYKEFPGYYIAKNGDSVLCKIDYGQWYINPKSIQVEVNNEKQILEPADIKGFGIPGFADYKAATVSFHTNPLKGSNLPENFSDSLETKTVFLKILVAGPYSLYELVLPQRFYYFIDDNNTAITELVDRARLKNLSIDEDPQYKNVFFGLFVKEGLLDRYQQRINYATYNGSDIKALVEILDEGHTGVKTVKINSKNFELDIFAGGTMHTFPSHFDGLYSKDNKFSSTFQPTGGLNLIYSFPSSPFKAGLSVAFETYSATMTRTGTLLDSPDANYYDRTNYIEKLSVTNSAILTDLYVMYFFNPFAKVKYFVKGGLALTLSISNDYNVRSSYSVTDTGITNGVNPFAGSKQGVSELIKLIGNAPHFNIGFGVATGNSKLELLYYTSSELNSENSPASFRIGMLSLYYYYSIFK